MNGIVASAMEDDIPALLESMYLHSTMASGDTDDQQDCYKKFCKELAALEGILKEKGILSEQRAEE